MSRSLKFTTALASRLREPIIQTQYTNCFILEGGLEITETIASIEVFIPVKFKDLKNKPPGVRCLESWMKVGVDWHNFEENGMCWIIPPLWRDVMSWKGKPVKNIISEGCDWLINDVTVLLDRHYFATLTGMNEWPEEWTAWSHYQKGIREYRNQKTKMLKGENK